MEDPGCVKPFWAGGAFRTHAAPFRAILTSTLCKNDMADSFPTLAWLENRSMDRTLVFWHKTRFFRPQRGDQKGSGMAGFIGLQNPSPQSLAEGFSVSGTAGP